MNAPDIRVAIVEDAAGTRANLVALLERSPGIVCVGAYGSGEQASRDLVERSPQVVLMDISLPGMSGIQAVAELKRRSPKTQFMMLTSYEDSDLIFESLRAGASGYLMKDKDPDEIVQAVRQIHAGGAPMSMSIARKVVNHFRQARDAAPAIEELTDRETQVLSLLAQGLMYKEIADKLGISPHTVRGHLHTVYEKLHVQTGTEAVLKYLGRK